MQIQSQIRRASDRAKLSFTYWRVCGFLLAAVCCNMAEAAETCTPPAGFIAATKQHAVHATDYGTLGNWFQDKRQLTCAAQAFKKGIALDAGSAPLHYSLGISLYAAGHTQDAASELEKSLQLDPRLARAHLALGVIDHESGQRSEALGHWQQALLIDPNMVTAIDWIAKARIEAGQFTAAAEFLKTVPDDEELLLDLIVADSKAGLFDDAISRAQKAIAAHPDWSRAGSALATVLVQRNRYEEAEALLGQEKQKNPTDQTIELLYLRVLVLKGNTELAAPLARQMLQQHPNDFDLLYLNGLLERQEGKYEAAIQHLQAATILQSKHYDVRYNLGFALAKLHRNEQARVQLSQAIALDSTAPEAHFQLAGVLRALGEADAAKEELTLYQQQMKARAKRDRDIAMSAEAAQKLESGDTASAISLYREVTEDAPEDAQAFYNLAMAFDRAGDLANERSSLLQALKLRASFAAAMNQLGYLASRDGRNDVAESYFRQAIASAPQFAEAESNLGTVLEVDGRHAEAEQYFRAALSANPRYTDAWINLAATLASESQFAEARSAAQSALQVDPRNADASRLLQSLPSGEAEKR